METYLQAYLETGFFMGSVLIARAGEVLLNQSYGMANLEPAGMMDSGYDLDELILSHRASGYIITETGYQNAPFWDMSQPSGAGAMYSTTEDLYKLDRVLHTDKLLNENSKQVMFSPTVRMGLGEPKDYYGYGWAIDSHFGRDRQRHYRSIYGFRAIISRYPAEQMVVIALSNVGEVSIERIANDLAAILFGKPYVLPKSGQIIEIDPAIYNAYVGDYTGAYEFAPGIILTISTESDRIFMQFTGQDRMEIFPTSSTEFFLKVLDTQLTFIVNDVGKTLSPHSAGWGAIKIIRKRGHREDSSDDKLD